MDNRFRWLTGFICIITFALLLPAFGASCAPGGYSGPAESITLGTVLFETAIPVFIAEDQQFFTRNGLNITLRYFDTGPQAINGMLRDEVDIVSPVAEYVLVGQAMEKAKIKTIGSFDKVDYVVVIGRKDRGITNIPELLGKKTGTIRGTALDFCLGRFLELRGLNITKVTLVNFPSLAQVTDAIVNGDVDAIVSAPPYSDDALSKLGGNAMSWKAQSGQLIYVLFIGEDEWIKEHPVILERFLKAIDQAEDFIIQHPESARSIAKKKLGLSDDGVSEVWARNQFALSLDQSLIAAMADEVRWMMSNNLTAEKQVPNFNNYIYEDALKAIKPEAVNIIR